MAEPFLAEIRIMSFGFAPKGWALCNGQPLPINQNQGPVFAAGHHVRRRWRVNFALPDNRGRTPIHVGSSHALGERGGEQGHTLSIGEIPTHIHYVNATNANATGSGPGGQTLANSLNYGAYRPLTSPTTLVAGTVGNVGGSQAHLNIQPFLTLSFCICAPRGIFPSQTLKRQGHGSTLCWRVRIFAGNFARLDGCFARQLLPSPEYETLFNLIGTTYGGDGQSTFALPDMRGRIPIHQGNSSPWLRQVVSRR